MNAPIDLDTQPFGWTIEVKNERANAMLTAEFAPPCVACSAMKIVPNRIPRPPATKLHQSDSPTIGPVNPSAIVKNWKFPRNQKGPCCQILPCRSSSGTQSIERTSIEGVWIFVSVAAMKRPPSCGSPVARARFTAGQTERCRVFRLDRWALEQKIVGAPPSRTPASLSRRKD